MYYCQRAEDRNLALRWASCLPILFLVLVLFIQFFGIGRFFFKCWDLIKIFSLFIFLSIHLSFLIFHVSFKFSNVGSVLENHLSCYISDSMNVYQVVYKVRKHNIWVCRSENFNTSCIKVPYLYHKITSAGITSSSEPKSSHCLQAFSKDIGFVSFSILWLVAVDHYN